MTMTNAKASCHFWGLWSCYHGAGCTPGPTTELV